MTFLLDTNAVTDFMNENGIFLGRMRTLQDEDRVIICPIVRGEILFGIARLPSGQRRETLAKKAASALAGLPCEPIGHATADIYSKIRRDCEAIGAALHENDLWIAAFALQMGAAVISRDRDFLRVPGLTVEDWTAR
jgi:predicted nucleic acid-binding protein